MKNILPFLLLVSCASPQIEPILEVQNVHTETLLQAISIVDESTVWLSGHDASFVRTTDGGENWEVFRHPTTDSLQFRDIHAFDKDNIILMSAGTGSLSQIFGVRNGTDWQQYFVMQDSLGFLDCMDFWDDQNGIAYGDAIDDYPYILLTANGGQNWKRADTTNMPKAGDNEGGFAASGTCVATGENGLAWIATGAGGNARVLMTEDYGKTWSAHESPIVKGDFAGHTSIDFTDNENGFVTGGDLAVSDEYTKNCAFTTDGGLTWQLTKYPVTKGAFYGSASAQFSGQNFTIVCGPNGMDYTSNYGQTWLQLDTANLWAVDLHTSGVGWVSGKDGRVIKLIISN